MADPTSSSVRKISPIAIGTEYQINQTNSKPLLTRTSSRESGHVSSPTQERRANRKTSRRELLTATAGGGGVVSVSPVLERKISQKTLSRTISIEETLISQLDRIRILPRTLSEEKINLDHQLPKLIIRLRELLKDDTQVLRKDDTFLAKFIRVKNYNVERALIGVRSYYQTIHKNYDLMHGIKPSQFISVYNDDVTYILKNRCKNGTKVGLVQIRAWDTFKHSLRQIQQAALFLIEEQMKIKETQLSGVSIIFDLKNFSFSHARHLTPKELKLLVTCGQGGLPFQIIGIHFINYPSIFWGIFYIAQGFMKQKLRQRIHFHNCHKSLYEHFHSETLPKSLGGPLESEEAKDHELLEKLLEHDKPYEVNYS